MSRFFYVFLGAWKLLYFWPRISRINTENKIVFDINNIAIFGTYVKIVAVCDMVR